jgi:hypothetical protein
MQSFVKRRSTLSTLGCASVLVLLAGCGGGEASSSSLNAASTVTVDAPVNPSDPEAVKIAASRERTLVSGPQIIPRIASHFVSRPAALNSFDCLGAQNV